MVTPYEGTIPGTNSAFLSKISPDGSSLLYSTYLGGSGDEVVSGVAVDSTGSALLAGYTDSTDFPVSNAYQATPPPMREVYMGITDSSRSSVSNGASLAYSTYLAALPM